MSVEKYKIERQVADLMLFYAVESAEAILKGSIVRNNDKGSLVIRQTVRSLAERIATVKDRLVTMGYGEKPAQSDDDDGVDLSTL